MERLYKEVLKTTSKLMLLHDLPIWNNVVYMPLSYHTLHVLCLMVTPCLLCINVHDVGALPMTSQIMHNPALCKVKEKKKVDRDS